MSTQPSKDEVFYSTVKYSIRGKNVITRNLTQLNWIRLRYNDGQHGNDLPYLKHLILLGKDLEHIVKRRDLCLSETVKVEFVAHRAGALSDNYKFR